MTKERTALPVAQAAHHAPITEPGGIGDHHIGLRRIRRAQLTQQLRRCGGSGNQIPARSQNAEHQPELTAEQRRVQQGKAQGALEHRAHGVVLKLIEPQQGRQLADALEFIGGDAQPQPVGQPFHLSGMRGHGVGGEWLHPSQALKFTPRFTRSGDRKRRTTWRQSIRIQPARAMAVASTTVEALSSRERDVLHCVMEGFSNREIARQLFVSPETVKTHVTNILSKLGARDRTHAVVLAVRTNQLQLL